MLHDAERLFGLRLKLSVICNIAKNTAEPAFRTPAPISVWSELANAQVSAAKSRHTNTFSDTGSASSAPRNAEPRSAEGGESVEILLSSSKVAVFSSNALIEPTIASCCLSESPFRTVSRRS